MSAAATPVPPTTVTSLRAMTSGVYDLQHLRIQTGLRLYANFRSKLKVKEGDQPKAEDDTEIEGDAPIDELSPEAEDLLAKLRDSYKRLTDGIARNRTLPDQKKFIGDELISTYAELALVDQYIRLVQQEDSAFRLIEKILPDFPIYAGYLNEVRGVGPALAAVLISYFDPHKAERPSGFWKYAGLDVGPDGLGRSRRAEHLIDKEYTAADGTIKTRKSLTYNPWLKSRLMGVLATSMMRTGSPFRQYYDNYKNRIVTDPNRKKVTVAQIRKARLANEDVTQMWTPGRVHMASLRYMVKQFLLEFWTKWREIEGLPIVESYHVAKQGGHKRVA